jgi:hypothetical protein
MGPYTRNRGKCHVCNDVTTIEEGLQTALSVGLLQGYMTQLTECNSVREYSAVEYSRANWVGEQSVRGLLQFSCEPKLLASGSWGKGIVRQPRVRGMFAVGSCYQATASGDCNRLRTLVCVWQWFVKCNNGLYKCAINPITNPNPIYSHSVTWQWCQEWLDWRPWDEVYRKVPGLLLL